MALSFITVGELLFWAEKRKWSAHRVADLHARLRSTVIVPYDIALCEAYGKLKARLQEMGRLVADNDLWIAACAIRHSLPLVTNNRAHFESIPDLVVISEAPKVAQVKSQAGFHEVQGWLPNQEPKKS